ncbi:hypothetical protein BLNAU_17868 [Blattamonas nauphoetae]|uniref:VPS9 domain-containing protein n=1 Tax=Blattamonas nauphoetae TaxID=2049346 RepID=A0ABQ9X632_9EUKA|nr:hypothetical protein BLNAU_17868 [Blattamonas nauphoetae]
MIRCLLTSAELGPLLSALHSESALFLPVTSSLSLTHINLEFVKQHIGTKEKGQYESYQTFGGIHISISREHLEFRDPTFRASTPEQNHSHSQPHLDSVDPLLSTAIHSIHQTTPNKQEVTPSSPQKPTKGMKGCTNILGRGQILFISSSSPRQPTLDQSQEHSPVLQVILIAHPLGVIPEARCCCLENGFLIDEEELNNLITFSMDYLLGVKPTALQGLPKSKTEPHKEDLYVNGEMVTMIPYTRRDSQNIPFIGDLSQNDGFAFGRQPNTKGKIHAFVDIALEEQETWKWSDIPSGLDDESNLAIFDETPSDTPFSHLHTSLKKSKRPHVVLIEEISAADEDCDSSVQDITVQDWFCGIAGEKAKWKFGCLMRFLGYARTKWIQRFGHDFERPSNTKLLKESDFRHVPDSSPLLYPPFASYPFPFTPSMWFDIQNIGTNLRLQPRRKLLLCRLVHCTLTSIASVVRLLGWKKDNIQPPQSNYNLSISSSVDSGQQVINQVLMGEAKVTDMTSIIGKQFSTVCRWVENIVMDISDEEYTKFRNHRMKRGKRELTEEEEAEDEVKQRELDRLEERLMFSTIGSIEKLLITPFSVEFKQLCSFPDEDNLVTRLLVAFNFVDWSDLDVKADIMRGRENTELFRGALEILNGLHYCQTPSEVIEQVDVSISRLEMMCQRGNRTKRLRKELNRRSETPTTTVDEGAPPCTKKVIDLFSDSEDFVAQSPHLSAIHKPKPSSHQTDSASSLFGSINEDPLDDDDPPQSDSPPFTTADRVIAADDLLPLMLYAFMKANPISLFSTLGFVSTFWYPSHASRLSGSRKMQSFNHLIAAVTFISQLDLDMARQFGKEKIQTRMKECGLVRFRGKVIDLDKMMKLEQEELELELERSRHQQELKRKDEEEKRTTEKSELLTSVTIEAKPDPSIAKSTTSIYSWFIRGTKTEKELKQETDQDPSTTGEGSLPTVNEEKHEDERVDDSSSPQARWTRHRDAFPRFERNHLSHTTFLQSQLLSHREEDPDGLSQSESWGRRYDQIKNQIQHEYSSSDETLMRIPTLYSDIG